jgi:hypothetical protein
MKKTVLALLVFSLLAPFAGVASAVEMGPAAGVAGLVDKHIMEGWIISVDYRRSQFRVLDPRGFQRVVTTKPGIIGDYRIGDRVRVEIDPDYKRARLIEKLY